MSNARLENVSALAGEMQGLARQARADYAAAVDVVILAHSRDTRHIERLHDGILDFGFNDAMTQLFKSLCRYYTLEQFKDSELGRIPKGWEVYSIGTLPQWSVGLNRWQERCPEISEHIMLIITIDAG